MHHKHKNSIACLSVNHIILYAKSRSFTVAFALSENIMCEHLLFVPS